MTHRLPHHSAFHSLALCVVVFALASGCDDTNDPVEWSALERSIDSLYLEIEGVGGVPLPGRGRFEVPPGTRLTIKQVVDHEPNERVTRSMRVSDRVRPKDGEQIIKENSRVLGLGEVVRVTGEGVGLGFWAEGPGAEYKETGGYHRSFAVVTAADTHLDEAYESWSLVLDRRDPRALHGLFTARILLPGPAWSTTDLKALKLAVWKSALINPGAASTGTRLLQLEPWRRDRSVVQSPRLEVIDATMEKQDEHLVITCEFSAATEDGLVTAFCPPHLGRWNDLTVDDAEDPDATEVFGATSIIRVPDWTTPIMRLSKERPEGMALSPDEIEAYEAVLSNPARSVIDE